MNNYKLRNKNELIKLTIINSILNSDSQFKDILLICFELYLIVSELKLDLNFCTTPVIHNLKFRE